MGRKDAPGAAGPARDGAAGPDELASTVFFRGEGGASPEPRPGLEPGKVVGDFRLIRILGEGGMGQVWEAAQASLGDRRVAIKFVRPDQVTPRQLELFKREARAGGRLSHPGIVAVHDYGESDGLSWIAMEVVEGAWSLREFIDVMAREEELPADYDRRVAEFVAEVADAMEAAHEAGIIHRDLKPQNILITPDDRPKVTDFGLARITSESALSVSGEIAGTFYYMSPEQVLARRRGLDHRTDVFSLGVVLYEMLALRRPFQGDTTHQISTQILEDDPTDLRDVRSRIPADLVVITGKALEKEPGRRYDSMAELADDLRRFLAHEPIHAAPPTTWSRVVKWAHRHPTKSVSGTLAAVAFVVISVLLVNYVGANRQLEVTVKERNDANQDLETERQKLADSNDQLRTTLDERDAANRDLEQQRAALADTNAALLDRTDELEHESHFAFLSAARAALSAQRPVEAIALLNSCPEELRGWEWEHMHLLLDRSRRVLRGHEGPVDAVVFSPDDTRLASISADSLRVWEVATGRELWTVDGHGEAGSWGLRYTSDGERLVSGSDAGLRIRNASNGALIAELGGAAVGRQAPFALSTDGLLAAGIGETGLGCWDARTGALLTRVDDVPGRVTALAFAPEGGRLLVGRDDGMVRVRAFPGAEVQASFEAFTDTPPERGTQASHVLTVAWDGRGSRFAACAVAGIKIWDTTSDRECCTIQTGDYDPGLRLSEDGELLMVEGSSSFTVYETEHGRSAMWDGEREGGRTPLFMLRSTPCPLSAFTRDGRNVVVGSFGGHIANAGASTHVMQVWDAFKGELRFELYGHEGPIHARAITSDGRLVATGSRDRTVRIWDMDPPDGSVTLEGTRADPLGQGGKSAIDASGERLASHVWQFTLRIWDLADGHVVQDVMLDWTQNASGSNRLVEACGDRRFVTTTPDGSLELYDADSAEPVRSFEGQDEGTYYLLVSNDHRRVVSCSEQGSVCVWDVETGRLVSSFRAEVLPRYPVDVNADGTRLVCSKQPTGIQVWDLDRGSLLHEHAGFWPRFHPRDDVYVSNDGYQVVLRDGETGEIVREFQDVQPSMGIQPNARGRVFSPDGTLLASAIGFEFVQVWDVATGKCLQVFEPGGPQVNEVAFSRDGQRLLVYGFGHTLVPIYDVVSGRDLLDLDMQELGAFSFSDFHFGPDDRVLVASQAEVLRIWPTSREHELSLRTGIAREQEARARVVRLRLDAFLDRDEVSARVEEIRATDPRLADRIDYYRTRIPVPTVDELNKDAWLAVDPDHPGQGNRELALPRARAAVHLLPEEAAVRDTLAWALVAAGQLEEAVHESERALALAPTDEKEEYGQYLARIRGLAEAKAGDELPATR